jgi:hypothetical protein
MQRQRQEREGGIFRGVGGWKKPKPNGHSFVACKMAIKTVKESQCVRDYAIKSLIIFLVEKKNEKKKSLELQSEQKHAVMEKAFYNCSYH